MLLGPGDPLPRRPQRVLVAGASGAGKTTVAAAIGRAWGLPHIEIDALFHGPNWVPRDAFVADVEAFSARPQWVTEWQYGEVRDVLAERASLLVWLDFPRTTVMRQVIVRTARRRLLRQELWNGNIEPPLWTIFTNSDHIVRWAWTTHARSAARVRELNRQRPDLAVVRLRTRNEAERWLSGAMRAAATTST